MEGETRAFRWRHLCMSGNNNLSNLCWVLVVLSNWKEREQSEEVYSKHSGQGEVCNVSLSCKHISKNSCNLFLKHWRDSLQPVWAQLQEPFTAFTVVNEGFSNLVWGEEMMIAAAEGVTWRRKANGETVVFTISNLWKSREHIWGKPEKSIKKSSAECSHGNRRLAHWLLWMHLEGNIILCRRHEERWESWKLSKGQWAHFQRNVKTHSGAIRLGMNILIKVTFNAVMRLQGFFVYSQLQLI